MVKVGDRIEILEKDLEYALVEVGDILTVSCVYATWFISEDTQKCQWSFNISGNGYKIITRN